MSLISEIKSEIELNPERYILPPVEYDDFARGLFEKRVAHGRLKIEKRLSKAQTALEEENARGRPREKVIARLNKDLQAETETLNQYNANTPEITPGPNGVKMAIESHADHATIVADIIGKNPAQQAASSVIADSLNEVTPDNQIPVTSVPWSEVVSAIGGAAISTLTAGQLAQLEVIKSDSINPQDAGFIAAVLAITGVDISELATRDGSIAESKGWRKITPGDVAMARVLNDI